MTSKPILNNCLYFITLICIATAQKCSKRWDELPNYKVAAERVYYIGCVEEKWNYCPSGNNLITGESINERSDAAIWCLGNGADRIGPEYIKALYREFTNGCFNEQKDRKERDEHLGALGPNIRALTGERIKVFYENKCSFPNSIHTHGLKYDKTSEGAPYNDGSTDGDIVAPNGGRWIYIFDARASMVDRGLSSKMWLYHSHVDEIKDIYSGLFGAIIITKNGRQRSKWNLMPKDINREFTTFMVLYDENESQLFDKNTEEYLGLSMRDKGVDKLFKDEDFVESNLMHAINGYLFGNLEDLDCREGEKVRWYTASFGNEGDGPHSPHWHGNIAVDAFGDNVDTVVLIPGTTSTVTMTVDMPGVWLYHCHVHDHIEAGMITTYYAEETGTTSL